ncbi:unnamed protein product [Pleuronectes platessa]|uniref:MADF domain-containing protein n=1 Tax=Pleuronectes platessa TaxID=8262 RepID=A0A9N7V0X9_PLEPL|nr:unnamed protein product [Pleuronectes platessa]
MDNREELLSEEVRKYEHLYNPSMSEYKDTEMASNPWKEILANVGLPVEECTKLWRRIRDKYVRQRKMMRCSSGDAADKKVPAMYLYLSWLGQHIKHRVTTSNYDKPTTTDKEPSPSTSSSPEVSPEPSTSSSPQAPPKPSTSSSPQAAPEPSTSSSPQAAPEPSTSSSPQAAPEPFTSAQKAFTQATNPVAPCPLSTSAKKRKRGTVLTNSSFACERGKLQNHRDELTARPGYDEFARAGLSLGDMVRARPEKTRRALLERLFTFVLVDNKEVPEV